MKTLVAAFIVVACAWGGSVPAAAGQHRLGLGIHYWRTIDAIEDEGFDRDGMVPVFSYQYVPVPFVKLEADLEYFDSGFGGARGEAFAPSVYVLLGGFVYGGVGVGVTVSDDFQDNLSDPWFAARLGLSLGLLPKTHLDFHLDYRSGSFDELEALDLDTDDLTLGAQIRFTL